MAFFCRTLRGFLFPLSGTFFASIRLHALSEFPVLPLLERLLDSRSLSTAAVPAARRAAFPEQRSERSPHKFASFPSLSASFL